MGILKQGSFVPKTHATFEAQYEGATFLDRSVKALRDMYDWKPKAEAEYRRLRKALEKVQLVLHAHSQGAIVAAVACTRVGSVPRQRSISADEANAKGGLFDKGNVPVAIQFKFVSYGGGANMLDWGPEKRFASYTHHWNAGDAVTAVFGMEDPFQTSPLVQAANSKLMDFQKTLDILDVQTFKLFRKIARPVFKGAVLNVLTDSSSAHQKRIASGPTRSEVAAWKNHHTVIWHFRRGDGFWKTPAHHNFNDAYACNVGTEDAIGIELKPLPHHWLTFRLLYTKYLNPREGAGNPDCLID